LGAT
jgi:hypothetical protein